MSVELINNHVLIPHDADWAQPPEWSRAWQTGLVTAVTGQGSRQALRAVARHALTWLITPCSLNEQVRLDDRVRAAVKLGLACAPFHGRGGALVDAFTGDTFQCRPGWDWTVGDYVFVRNSDGYEISRVASANLELGTWTVELEDVLTGTYRDFAWPLIFGKFTCAEMEAASPRVGPLRVTISELTNARSAQLGSVAPPSGAGIGVMVVADDFTVT